MSRDRITELRDELSRIAEELAEVALDVLRQAVDEGATARPLQERALAQARRAVERAVHVLDPHTS